MKRRTYTILTKVAGILLTIPYGVGLFVYHIPMYTLGWLAFKIASLSLAVLGAWLIFHNVKIDD
jgi:hypothetical protein